MEVVESGPLSVVVPLLPVVADVVVFKGEPRIARPKSENSSPTT